MSSLRSLTYRETQQRQGKACEAREPCRLLCETMGVMSAFFCAASQEGAILMRAVQALDNFALVARTRAYQGWDASPVCTWSGVICSVQQSVIGVNFTMPPPPLLPFQANMGHDILLTGMSTWCHIAPIPDTLKMHSSLAS